MTLDPQDLRILEALLFAAATPLDEASLAEQLPEGAEIQALLDRWCSMTYSLQKATGWRKRIKKCRNLGRATFFRRYLEELALDLP